ncbi:DNA repair protein Rad9 [Westerdykella ornata]|uniref:DNA repair protein rad9 n=1 Tax=Westerdykella ornata TaxID=318751 RepID=A0A6A6JU37_WESOR|nr:DNA repair protein Rad9 [Westerdykella ornata]KAF2280092.1 DNA repair protein Rad9 [Westerdykella ornata]
MVVLNFTLTPEAAAKVHDILICLAKFSDTVAIEARRERFTFTALNSSKSAYAALTLDGNQFFASYEFLSSHGGSDGRFTCSMYAKALLSVFKARLNDPLRRDGAIDRCEVSIQDRPDATQCRFIVKMVCDQGVIKTYKLTYEAVDVMHALFDRNAAKNRWSMHSSAMKEYIEYFGPRNELLDIVAGQDGRAIFKTYTDKLQSGKDILKHSLSTAVAVNTGDFEEFKVDSGLHIVISAKDFKAIVAHAVTLKTNLKAYYSQPTRPLQFSYGSDGVLCEFTLMTSGDYDASANATPAPQQIPSRTASQAQSAATERIEDRSIRSEMPPPVEPASRAEPRRRIPGSRKETTPKPPQPGSQGLFVSQDDEDARWEPVDYNNEEETLGWDASAEHDAALFPTFRDNASLSRTETAESNDAVAPTQRVSQIKGLW